VEIKLRATEKATILDLTGNFVIADASNFRARVKELLDSGTKNIAVNLSGVVYLDSSGIGAIVGVFSAARAAGAKCRFYAPSKQALQVLQMVRLDKVLDLRADEASALADL
jgi:anti-sigma B factor antagonist